MTDDVTHSRNWNNLLAAQLDTVYAHDLGATVIVAHFHSESQSQIQTNMNYVAWWRGEL